jgi:hypothetical protein
MACKDSLVVGSTRKSPASISKAAHAVAALLAVGALYLAGCKAASSSMPTDGGAERPASAAAAVHASDQNIALRFMRAWPAPAPGPGIAVGLMAGAALSSILVTGDAAQKSVPDRCPDHDECKRIANNGADVAHASCDGQCDRCCPHRSADDCATAECAGACQRCRDDACRRSICSAGWLEVCRDRCRTELDACAGCRSVWCGEGPALRACHSDVDSHHRATLAACQRDCPPGERGADGSCSISCGTAKTPSCSKRPKDCTNGRSPDCRCECTGAVAGICGSWTAVCTCD